MEDKVRILKDTGKYTTVPLRRLSTTDRQYVEELVASVRDNMSNLLVDR